MSRRRFFVDQFHHGQAVIAGERARHLRTVLRVQPGQILELSDTRRLYLARVARATHDTVTFHLEDELDPPPPLPELTLLAAIIKFDRFEWMLEKSTELAVTKVVPVIAAHTDPALGRAAQKRVERWRRIVLEAAQQSRRLAPPEVAGPVPLAEAVAALPDRPRWILDETLPGPACPASRASILLTGPEGGFTDAERALARRHRFEPVSLGPLILRSETASVAALSVLLYLGNPPHRPPDSS